MIFDASLDERRESVLQYLEEQKFARVLDIGGAMWPWARKYVTHYLDVLSVHDILSGDLYDCDMIKNAQCFKGDINDNFGWQDVGKDILFHGLFDFAICSQVLEDIRNPSYVLRTMPLIAKEGFVTVPTKYRELTRVEGHGPNEQKEWNLNGTYPGYFHHRWIWSVQLLDGALTAVMFPKLQFTDCLGLKEMFDPELYERGMHHELSFRWKGPIPYKIINDDFLGPNPPTVFDFYREELKKGL